MNDPISSELGDDSIEKSPNGIPEHLSILVFPISQMSDLLFELGSVGGEFSDPGKPLLDVFYKLFSLSKNLARCS